MKCEISKETYDVNLIQPCIDIINKKAIHLYNTEPNCTNICTIYSGYDQLTFNLDILFL